VVRVGTPWMDEKPRFILEGVAYIVPNMPLQYAVIE
jgi:hypothetical protein